MNQYPTLFLSLKDVDGTTFENAFNMLKFVISSLCSQNSYLETGENIRENEKDIFSRLRSHSIDYRYKGINCNDYEYDAELL